MSTVERIERLWGQLCRNPDNRYWEEAYARWLRWVDALGDAAAEAAWSEALAPVVASLLPGFVHPKNPCFRPDATPCLRCGDPIWRGLPTVLHEPQSPRCRVGPTLIELNAEPSARGRWLVDQPGLAFATFAPGIDMVRWPLPRYTSHLVTCPDLIRQRAIEQEMVAEKVRDAVAKRKRNRADREARIKEAVGA